MDLHVIPPVGREGDSRRVAELAKVSGFSAVALTVPTGLMPERLALFKQVFSQSDVEVFFRADLKPSSRKDLLRLLRRYRNSFDIVSVNCQNQVTATVACRDRRVDLVFFDPRNDRVRFTHALANQLHGAVEFNVISNLIGGANINDTFAKLSKDVRVAAEHRVPIVVSSGASSLLALRSPVQLVAVAKLLGLDNQEALTAVSQTPFSIASRNLERRSPSYIEEGVKVVLSRAV